MVSESSSLASVLGGRTASAMRSSRGLETVGDLLAFWPRRYYSGEADLSEAVPGRHLVAVATVLRQSTFTARSSRRRILTVTISDGSTELDLVFFKPYGHEAALQPGVRGIFAGKVTTFQNRLQLAHPGYTVLDDVDEGERNRLIPVYLAVERMHTWRVTESVRLVLESLGDVADAIPDEIVQRRGLVSRRQALGGIHTPRTWADVERAKHRLRFEEALVLQVVLQQRRAEAQKQRTTARPSRAGGLLSAFDERLPFTLTDGQRDVGEQILTDLAAEIPMHRLLQGEVGSGKTVVALRAMLAAVDAGGQAALLAPTEVLAAQHHATITRLLGDLAEGGLLGGSEIGTRVALLTGSQSVVERKKALLDTASGDAGIVVGTHALIQQHVSFFDLALVVVDEQHRFGVEQRDALRGKGRTPPHVLVMTATPIPRTVAMTVFGDLETSTLRELPAGRAPITTHVVEESKPHWVERTWARVAEEARAGRQVYVVCPRIGEDDDPDAETQIWTAALDEDGEATSPRPLRSVYAVHAELASHPLLQGLRLGVLHGRLTSEEKDSVMAAFAAGEVDVLVSTTVIEVGVDVPNACVMVVMDADRFGVSQLHQLRGRVGRGGLPGLCLLMTGSDADTTRERLEAVAATTDGFTLARLDIAQRREGDILGAAQHGRRTQLEFLHILDHEELIEQARTDAQELVGADPALAAYPVLAAAAQARVDAEQAAYLERG